LRSAALAAGLTRMRRAPFIANSRPALEAAEYAKEVGLHDPYHRATFSAYFDDQRNIGDRAVLKEIAEGVGLDWPTLEERLETGYYTELVERQIAEAHQLGLTGVPAYILDRYLIVGAQPYEVFRHAMQRIAEDRAKAEQR
jgi:predicted DsbA family dithiol-disulfide isomerase